jgi:nucleoside-diphosphate-sugar epimerase
MRIKDARQTFIGVWIANLLQDKPIEVWGGAQLRDLNYVEDVVEALMLAVVKDEAQGKVFNLGCREVIDLKRLAGKLIAANNGCGRIDLREFPAERKVIDIGDYYGDFSLFRKTTGWEPRWSIDAALKATLDYYRDRFSHYL